MAQAGILTEDDRVELLDGEIVQMTPIVSNHADCVNRLNQLLSERLGTRAIVSVQNPVRLSERSEPQPDLALLALRPDFYAASHPGPVDVLLVIEVAEISVELDRRVKMPLYARAGIREVWLVDLALLQIEVFRNPSPNSYQDMRRVTADQRLFPLAFPDLEFAAAQILTLR